MIRRCILRLSPTSHELASDAARPKSPDPRLLLPNPILASLPPCFIASFSSLSFHTLTHSCSFSAKIRPLFSYSYKLLFPQLFSFDTLTNYPGVYPPCGNLNASSATLFNPQLSTAYPASGTLAVAILEWENGNSRETFGLVPVSNQVERTPEVTR